jgi:hypothetical protein
MTTATIQGFKVEFTEEYGTTDVMIQYGNFCSSLEFAKAYGELENGKTGDMYPIKATAVAKIQAWADTLGY